MRSGATEIDLDYADGLLRQFAVGKAERRLVMDRLDMTYSELLELLHQRGLHLPSTPEVERAAMVQTLHRLLGDPLD